MVPETPCWVDGGGARRVDLTCPELPVVCAVGGRISPPPSPGSSVLDAAYVDYGAHAMRSIEGLLDTLCEIAKLPADDIKRAPPPRSAEGNGGDDPAKGALRSLSGIASLIVQKAPATW